LDGDLEISPATAAGAGDASRARAALTPGMGDFARDESLVVNGVQLHIRRWGGSGPWLVLLTGLDSAADTFDELAASFTDCCSVLGLTRRGQPPSESPATGYDILTLTRDVAGVLDAYAIDRAHFAGHSLGGLEMTELAVRQPERVSTLVFLDAGIDPASAFELIGQDPLGGAKSEPGSVAAQIDQWWSRYTPPYRAITAPTLSLYAVQPNHPDVPTGADETLVLTANEFWQRRVIPWVHQQAATFAREVPHAEIELLEPASHYLYRDRLPDVVRLMRAFYGCALTR
jgi:pimeloyl-ACP methyl ester carboxylesterase